MNKKGQVQAILGAVILIMVLSALIPAITQSINAASCNNEKATIQNLQNQLSQCQNLLSGEQQKSQSAITNLEECKRLLEDCQSKNLECNNQYVTLQEECQKKEQPVNIYYFIKVFSDKIILFDLLVIYNIQLFALFLSFGITFTIKLFEIDVEIKVLNKKNQKKLVRIIRQYLIDHPYVPVVFMIVVILLTNLLLKVIS
ncbi:hypothetical protein KY347_03710 [Candidatus Woesearchaeota archaeon]|nr:hypothetical protein [Candidatus Woesearchaeota archaeon]